MYPCNSIYRHNTATITSLVVQYLLKRRGSVGMANNFPSLKFRTLVCFGRGERRGYLHKGCCDVTIIIPIFAG